MTERLRRILCVSLLVLGIAMIVVGILRGEAETVFKKAVRICMECIGIG